MNESWRPPNIQDPSSLGLMRSGVYSFRVSAAAIKISRLGRPYIHLTGNIVSDTPNSELATFPYLGREVHVYFAAWHNDLMKHRANELGLVIIPELAEAACKKYIGRVYDIRCRVIMHDRLYNQFDLLKWTNEWEFLK